MDPKPSPSFQMDPKPSPSSSGMSRRNYDVFLSFRGPDTRHTIVSHLHLGLLRSGLYNFKDSEELEAGDKRDDLFDAIKGSRVAVVVFSKSYADSKWCLDELTKIIEQWNMGKLTVIPIFYRVPPGEVRLHEKQNGEKGCYQIAMEAMETKYGKDWVTGKNWRKSLWEGGNLIGFPLLEGDDEGEVVDKVVKRVLKVCSEVPLHVAKYPVGIGRRLEEIKPLLHLDPHVNDVYMVGIHGLGGVGKTTLSKAICNEIRHEFDAWCFLPNVRETSKFFNGLVSLQEKLLQHLVDQKNLSVSSIDLGKHLIRQRLRRKRVLIVLDDVDKLDQFDALAGSDDWFGDGSRIIITTRDSHVLAHDRVRHIYQVSLLELTDADDLFQCHAFGGRWANARIRHDLVDRLLCYCDGLPLALTVLGSFLMGRNAFLWESTLEMLDKEPVQDINSVLKISFLGLDPQAQELFLDMACFFKGWDEDYVMKVLDSFGFAVLINVQILVERCLLTIEDGKFQMHDLLEVMGKSIVHDRDAGMPSRIRTSDELRHVLSENGETDAVEGIVLDLAGEENELINPTTFKGFKRLRLLMVRNVPNFEGCLHLPGRLRWFSWPGYSGSTIEFNYSKELVGLDLHESKVNQVKGEAFRKLKYLNLSNCINLESIPYILLGSKLEDLNLYRCTSLTRLDDCIGLFGKLVHLNLGGCHNLVTVPCYMISQIFRTIDFSGCFKLDKFPHLPGKLEYLDKLVLDNMGIEELPESIGNLVAVKSLSFANCRNLSVIPSSIYKLRGLEILHTNGCPMLYQFPRKPAGNAPDVDGFCELVLLDMQECNLKEVEFLSDLTCFMTLKKLLLSHNGFRGIPDCLNGFRNLEELSLQWCRHLVEVPRLPGVIKLSVQGCLKLTRFPCLHTFICQSRRRFQVDLSECDNLDQTCIMESLHFVIAREFVGIADVIMSREIIPSGISYWTFFRTMLENPYFRVPLPQGMSKYDILGLMLSVTLDDFSLISVVDKNERLLIRRSAVCKNNSVHTWVVYLPGPSITIHEDEVEDSRVDMDWTNIAFRILSHGTRLKSIGVQIICKREQDSHKFVVHRQPDTDYNH